MDNLNIFKKMGRFITAQLNLGNRTQSVLTHHQDILLRQESRLIIDAWNIQAAHHCCDHLSIDS